MTKSLGDLLNLPPLDEALAAQADASPEPEDELDEDDEQIDIMPIAPASKTDLITQAEMRSDEHSKSMDKMHDELIEQAREMVELGMNLDPARAPRMFEVAATYYKTALDAKVSKRDAQLKLMKLIQEQRKLELAELKLQHEMGDKPIDKAEVVMVEDRNELLRRLRDEAKGLDK